MTFGEYKNKAVTIVEMAMDGIVEKIIHRRTDSGALGIRLYVRGSDKKLYECQPHQIKLKV